MKNIIFTLCLFFIVSAGYSQLKIVSNGDLGIGTTSPIAKFHLVDGTASLFMKKISSGNPNHDEIFDISPGLTGSLRLGPLGTSGNAFGGAVFQLFSDNHVNFPGRMYFDAGSDPASFIVFRTSSATRMSIIQTGEVGIGTTSPTERLHVIGNIKHTGSLISSDKNLKKKVKPLKLGLKEVLKMNPVSFEYNGKGGTIEGDVHIGVLAQELQEIAPSLVKEYEYTEVKEATIDKDYEVVSVDTYLEIKDNEVKYLLVNAIKDQQKIIEEKEERIAQLENQMSEVQKLIDEIRLNGLGSQTIESEVTLTNYDYAELTQNRPNPFNGSTFVEYTIPSDAKTAQMQIYDINGQLMKTLSIEHKGQGQLKINAEDIPSGIYAYKLIVDGREIGTKKMILQN